MAGGQRDHALSLLAAANNHGDLAVKLSSLKQAKYILVSADSSLTSELFPYLVELQFSPESLVRKALVEAIEEIVLESMEYSSILVPVLLTLSNDNDPVVARLSVVAGANIFWSVLKELTSQFHRRGMVERWLEELWSLMIKFKETVFRIPLVGASIGPKLLALKFVESFALLLTPDNSERRSPAGLRTAWTFNPSWLVAGHPILDAETLKSEANRAFDILVKLLRSAGNLSGAVIISVVNRFSLESSSCVELSCRKVFVQVAYTGLETERLNSYIFGSKHSLKTLPWFPCQIQSAVEAVYGLVHEWYCDSMSFLESRGAKKRTRSSFKPLILAAIARKRPTYYNSVLSVLLDFHANFEASKGVHTASVQYSLRTAFLGFLRCTYPPILESRDRLLRALRGMNAGDAADQAIRQADKILRNSERASRDARLSKEEQTPNQVILSGDQTKKRSTPLDLEEPTDNYDSKRIRYNPINHASLPVQMSDSGQDNAVNGVFPKVPLLDGALTPVEQMIAMIGALIAEGERGVESLDILVSKIQPDLLADIVITNMKHLPKNPPPLVNLGNLPVTKQSDLSSDPSQILAPVTSSVFVHAPIPAPQVPLLSNVFSSLSDTATTSSADTKRDPRRDPRRLDPRRIAVPVGAPSEDIVEDTTSVTLSGPVEAEVDSLIPLNKPGSLSVVTSAVHVVPKTEFDLHSSESLVSSRVDRFTTPKDDGVNREAKEVTPDPEADFSLDVSLSPIHEVVQDLVEPGASDVVMTEEAYSLYLPETDQLSPPAVDTSVSEEACLDLPVLPLYVELAEEQQRNIRKLAIGRVIDSYKQLQVTENMQTRMALLARLVAQTGVDDDAVVMIQKHIVSDYQHQKGHELVMHVLYHLHSLVVTDSHDTSVVRDLYENFLLGVAKSLLDALPATDKSFSRLFGEAPFLPDSALKLLDDICCSDNSDNAVRDSDRVTQGLGSLWSLILGRPQNRQACLDIALKCSVHTRDDIRAKAIRLVSNKLYVISYIAENIEDFASNMLLSAVDRHASDLEQRTEGETGSQETSISGSQTEAGTSENDSSKGAYADSQSDSSMSFFQAQRQISLYFSLCTKKPSLLQLVFHHYGRAPKAVKQAIHRHIPILLRALSSSYSELLRIISDPPQGSENLLIQVLHIFSEGTTPSADLVATVKRLYETKLKDATILIPILSSFTKTEVLPIFPRLVGLPLDKFQTALAHILQGSAHTGPALTPAEVLVAIHDIIPEKDGVALKKIMDACSACFEQRTVFTHQVLAKALNQMVDQTPLPLLFMRTVIQAIDAFPTLVDFVMEILSKLVDKQVWRLPKLWVGFLKCVSQTQPHSFTVLLQLPAPQLEGALNKHPKLRSPLAAYANQPSVRASLPRPTLQVLCLGNESHVQHVSSSFHNPPDKNPSSLHGATLT